MSDIFRNRSQYPAILIGELCVFYGFGHKAFGYDIADEMKNLIKTIAIDTENNSSSRYLIVYALHLSSAFQPALK